MITGTSGGVDTTTSRPDPRRRRRSMMAAAGRWVLIASRPSSAVSAVTTVYCRICRNFTSGWRTALSSSTTRTTGEDFSYHGGIIVLWPGERYRRLVGQRGPACAFNGLGRQSGPISAPGPDLLLVVPGVDQVKPQPLIHGEGAQNRVVQHPARRRSTLRVRTAASSSHARSFFTPSSTSGRGWCRSGRCAGAPGGLRENIRG